VVNKDGWWDFMVGSKKPIDTDKFFVICTNVIGGCMGSFGPKEINPQNKKPYASNFPFLTIYDMVKAQNLLIEKFGINRLHALIGGSAGGMQVLAWAVLFPQKINILIPMSTSYRHTPQNIAFHEVGRQAIMTDPDWCSGDYLINQKFPKNGLSLARMMAHITYLSEKALQNKFGRDLKNKQGFSYSTQHDFQVENYLHYQGNRFVERFDPNSYLIITRAVDYFDLESDYDGNLSGAFVGLASNKTTKVCVISFSDDWLFPPSESKKLTHAFSACNINVSSVIIDSEAGHDSFLLRNNIFEKTINGLLIEN
jgi:homoserine O-acetyltransferase